MMLALRFSFIYLTGAAAYVTGRGADITVIPFRVERSPYRNAERTCSQPKLDNMQECLPCMAKCLDKLVIQSFQSHPKVKYTAIDKQ